MNPDRSPAEDLFAFWVPEATIAADVAPRTETVTIQPNQVYLRFDVGLKLTGQLGTARGYLEAQQKSWEDRGNTVRKSSFAPKNYGLFLRLLDGSASRAPYTKMAEKLSLDIEGVNKNLKKALALVCEYRTKILGTFLF